MTLETNSFRYLTNSNRSNCDTDYNSLPDYNPYAFGSPTYSISSSSNHSGVESTPSILNDDNSEIEGKDSLIREGYMLPCNSFQSTKIKSEIGSLSTLPDSINDTHHLITEMPLLTPPTHSEHTRSRFLKPRMTFDNESLGGISPQSIMHPYCYSLPPLTCYLPNCKCDMNFPFAYNPNQPIPYTHNGYENEKKNHRNRSNSKTTKYNQNYEKVLATAPRRYQCTLCVKRFTRPSSLATHMHSHTGEKPFQCRVNGCGRRFSVESNLRRHAKIHLSSSASS